MALLVKSSVFLLALTLPAVSHWVQDLDLYEDPPGTGEKGKTAGEKWPGCVLKSCKSPAKFQTRCPEDEDPQTFTSLELAQDAVFASNLAEKSEAVAAYMRIHSQHFKQDLKAIWANNGKGLLMGFPGNRPEIIAPNKAKDYKVYKAKFQQENPACTAGKRLGEVQMAVTVQKFIGKDGKDDDGSTDGVYDKTSVPMLRVRIENHCEDCGSSVDKGFYLRIQHTVRKTQAGAPVKPVQCAAVDLQKPGGEKDWADTFEFTGRKALPCGSTGSFDVLLTDLEAQNDKHGWPCEIKITLVDACREELAFLHMVPPDASANEKIVAPSWLGSFWR